MIAILLCVIIAILIFGAASVAGVIGWVIAAILLVISMPVIYVWSQGMGSGGAAFLFFCGIFVICWAASHIYQGGWHGSSEESSQPTLRDYNRKYQEWSQIWKVVSIAVSSITSIYVYLYMEGKL